MKRVTTNEIKDIALFAVAYSMLQNDSETEGVFLNKATSDKLLELKDAMFHVLSKYNAGDRYRVLNQIDRMHNAMVAKSTEFTITAVQLALSILTLWLPKNERKGRKLCDNLTEFWSKYEKLVRDIEGEAIDTIYADQAVDAEQLAYMYIGEML